MRLTLIILILFFSSKLSSNSANSFGTVGVNHSPSARFYEEGTLAISLSNNNDFRRLNLLAQPYNWLEVSIFYSDLFNLDYPASLGQSYKDKGFNMKIKLKNESANLPQLALGLSDFAGTGLFSGEYLVGSKRFGSFDFSLGLGWGIYAEGNTLKNPLKYFSQSFEDRNYIYGSTVGEFDFKDYFSGKDVGIFSSIIYTQGKHNLIVDLSSSNFKGRFGIIDEFSQNYIGYRFSANLYDASMYFGDKEDVNFSVSFATNYANYQSKKFKKVAPKHDAKILNLIDNLQANNIGLKEINVSEDSLQIGIRQNSFLNVNESVLFTLQSLKEAQITEFKEVTVLNYSFGSLITKHQGNFEENTISRLDPKNLLPDDTKIFSANEKFPRTQFNISPSLRTFIASREQFLLGGLLLNADALTYFSESMYLDTKLGYSVADNFDKLSLEPVTTFPAQVRSDIKDYLKGMSDGVYIDRFELNYLKKNKNNYFSFKAGILEQMFSGAGFEYLNLDQFDNFAFGFEAFQVKKRDYKQNFDHLDYETFTGHLNFYHYYSPLNLTTHISMGRYLAGDDGVTIDFSKRFKNGFKLGAFATFTDVSSEDFGEGSFDKGIYVTIPLSGFNQDGTSGFRWTPLTKDPGQKLNLSHRIFNITDRYIY
jgi:hypothetical protein